MEGSTGSIGPPHPFTWGELGNPALRSPPTHTGLELKCSLTGEPTARIWFASEHPGEPGWTSRFQQGVWMSTLHRQLLPTRRSFRLCPPCFLVCPRGWEGRDFHSECPLPFFFFSSSSPSLAPKRVKMIPVWELTPTAVTTIRPEPSMTWVPMRKETKRVVVFLYLDMFWCETQVGNSPLSSLPHDDDTHHGEEKVKSWAHLK